jgi:CO/xanthine dehydrogenase Mo-binding subunit
MRAPGEAQGNFAVESAIDELSYELGMDPLELRRRNYAEVHPQFGLPWSSKALRECYQVGAERFGWSRRNPEVASMRDGHWQVGYGLAGVAYSWWQVRCEARATMRRDGTAVVRSAAGDIGTGTYTVMRQLSAELLGLELAQVRVDLGDSDMPWSPAAGGSGLTTSLGTAVHAACQALLQRFLDLVANDGDSPLRGCAIDDVAVAGGRIHRRDNPGGGESYTDVLAQQRLDELPADGTSTPHRVGGRRRADPQPEAGPQPDHRGTVGGIGQALFEETIADPGTGRIANATLADYLVPVHADVPDMDVVFVGEPDPLTPIGTKGVGEIGLPGTAAAIANAVYHATGRRIRSLPITIDQLL